MVQISTIKGIINMWKHFPLIMINDAKEIATSFL